MNRCTLHQPGTLIEALKLHAGQDGALYVAGGATLVAMLNAKLLEPSVLISLERVEGLAGIDHAPDGSITIAAMTRHAVTANDSRLSGALQAVREAAGHIASPAIRNMGTIGGSISFADPGADYPAALVAAGASVAIAGIEGERVVAAEEFFVDWYATALESGELVRAVLLPSPTPGAGGAYEKLSRVEGDYATASAAATVRMEDGRCKAIRFAVGGCGPTPIRIEAAETELVGTALLHDDLIEAGRQLAAAADPIDDVRGSASYRRDVIPVLVARAALRARERAGSA